MTLSLTLASAIVTFASHIRDSLMDASKCHRYLHKYIRDSRIDASKCHHYLCRSTDLVPLGKGSPLWQSLFVGQCSCSCELGTATVPRVLYVDCPLFAGFAQGAGSYSRHCHRVPQQVALYTFLSCLWRKFRLAKRCHHKLNVFVLYHLCVPFILLSRSLSSLIPLHEKKITT